MKQGNKGCQPISISFVDSIPRFRDYEVFLSLFLPWLKNKLQIELDQRSIRATVDLLEVCSHHEANKYMSIVLYYHDKNLKNLESLVNTLAENVIESSSVGEFWNYMVNIKQENK